MKAVYVAGAYSAPDVMGVLANMRRGIALCARLLEAGYAPFCPWADYHFVLASDRITKDMLYAFSLEWLRRADAVVVVEEGAEASVGTQAEIAEAHRCGIPVYTEATFLGDLRELKKPAGPQLDISEADYVRIRADLEEDGGSGYNGWNAPLSPMDLLNLLDDWKYMRDALLELKKGG